MDWQKLALSINTCLTHQQDTIKAYREATASPPPTTNPAKIDPELAKTLGFFPHGKPFLWPAPRDPATYNTHPLKPSEYRSALATAESRQFVFVLGI